MVIALQVLCPYAAQMNSKIYELAQFKDIVYLLYFLSQFHPFEWLIVDSSISGYGEFAELENFTRAVAGTESYSDSEPVWTELHQENKLTEQPFDINDGISSMQNITFKITFC